MGADGRAWHSSQFLHVNDAAGIQWGQDVELSFDKPAENVAVPSKPKPAKVERLPERVGIVPPRGINKKNRRKRARMAAKAIRGRSSD